MERELVALERKKVAGLKKNFLSQVVEDFVIKVHINETLPVKDLRVPAFRVEPNSVVDTSVKNQVSFFCGSYCWCSWAPSGKNTTLDGSTLSRLRLFVLSQLFFANQNATGGIQDKCRHLKADGDCFS